MRPQRGVAWSAAEYTGVSLVRAWESAEHPRVLHGEHGGQFARKPGGGEPKDAKSGISVLLHSEVDRRGMGDRLWLPLEHAAKALDKNDIDGAVAGLTATADEAYKAGRTDDAETLRAWAGRISGLAAPQPPANPAWADPDKLYQKVKSYADQAEAVVGPTADLTHRLRAAQRAMERGDRAGFTLAASYIGQAEGSPETSVTVQKRLRELQHEVLNVPEPAPPAGPARTVQAFTSKGAKVVPGLLGGGTESWNGQIRTSSTLSNPNAIADMDWDASIGYLNNVAAGLNTDLSMTGEPIRGTDNFSVPLHELIHGVIGGQEQERRKAHDEAVKGLRGGDRLTGDASALIAFHNADQDQFYASGGEPGPYWQTLPEVSQVGPIGKAQADWLAAHGYLDKQGDQYRLSAKGTTALPVDHERYVDSRSPYQHEEMQAIEEGFTELGTIQHAPEFFDAMGVGDRKTAIVARKRGWPVGSPPGPQTQRQVAREMKDLLDQTGDGHVAKALALWDEGKWNAALDSLDTARNRSLGPEYAWLVDGIFGHVPAARGAVSNAEYTRVKAQLVDHLSAESERIRSRKYSFGYGGKTDSGRLTDLAELEQLERAMARAANDIDQPGGPDFAGAFEELGRLQHSGDPVFADDAMRLNAEVGKLHMIPAAEHATLSEYARRLQDRDRILNGDAWGHYPQQTRWALQWAEAVAMAERPKLTGAKLRARVVELADEVNREGTANKVQVMADQVIRAGGLQGKANRAAVAANIRDGWLRGGGAGVFADALNAAKGK